MARRLVLSLTDDARGFRRAAVSHEHRTLGAFLETGVGHPTHGEFKSLRAAAVDGLANGTNDDYTGDAFFVEIEGLKTRIRCLYNDDLDLTIPTEDFVAALDVYADYWATDI